MKNNGFLKQIYIVIYMLSNIFISQHIFAHGYVFKPESRSYACKLNKNRNCGGIVWEPQSLEGTNNFPRSGPRDGRIASADDNRFLLLDEQSSTRWFKTRIPTGENQFTWKFSARHVTKGWRYFLTKPNWNPNVPLTRASFDLNPFCTADGQQRQPPEQITHNCNIPSDRHGYHIILAIWDIGDTANSFYNVIDAQLGSGQAITPPPTTSPVPTVSNSTWRNVGEINPTDDLKPNDKVKIRIFEQGWENTSSQIELIILTNTQGQRNYWTRDLAEKINYEHNILRAGRKDTFGNFRPVLGQNQIFTPTNSHIERVEIKIERAPIQPQSTASNYHYIYPQNIQQYKAGTKVLASNGRIYQCRPYPYSGWCTIHAYQYIPGSGSHWQDAWILIN